MLLSHPWVFRMNYPLQENSHCALLAESPKLSDTGAYEAAEIEGERRCLITTRASQQQKPRRTKEPHPSALPAASGRAQAGSWQCLQPARRACPTPDSAQPGRRVGGAIAGKRRHSSKAGGDHKWKSVVKHGGERRLTLTFTVPPQKSTPR